MKGNIWTRKLCQPVLSAEQCVHEVINRCTFPCHFLAYTWGYLTTTLHYWEMQVPEISSVFINRSAYSLFKKWSAHLQKKTVLGTCITWLMYARPQIPLHISVPLFYIELKASYCHATVLKNQSSYSSIASSKMDAPIYEEKCSAHFLKKR